MKAEDLIARLDSETARLRKLEGEDIAAYFFVMPPDVGDPLTEAFIGSGPSKMAFYKYLADKIQAAQTPQDSPYITAGRGVR